jgi:aspartate beta-hydroxylase
MIIEILKQIITRYITFFTKRNPPILDLQDKDFSSLNAFEESAPQIRKEVEQFIKENWKKIPTFNQVDKGQNDLASYDDIAWKTLFVKMYDNWIDQDVSPTVTKLLKNNPNISSALFSCLDAGKHIPPHEGPNNGILRYTLPIVVPQKDACYLVIDGKRVNLEENKGVLWDDTYTHSASNESNAPRVALLLDLKKQMPAHVSFVYSLAMKIARISPAFKKAEKVAKSFKS